MPCIPLHPLLDLGQCIYIEGRWTPQSIKHRCIEYCYTKYISIAQCNPAQVLPSQLSTDVLHTVTLTARSRTMHIYRRQMDPQSISHRCLAYCYTHCQIQDNAYLQKADGPPSQSAIDALNTITLHIALLSQSSTDAQHTATLTARSRTMHIYGRQMAPQSIKHRCLAYCYTHCQIQDNAYLQKADGPPSQSAIDALNTITLHVTLPSQLSTDALHITTPTARSRTMPIYRSQIDPQSIEHMCIEYHYTKYIRIAKCHAAQILQSQLSTDALHTTTTTARSRTMPIYRSQIDPLSIEHMCIEYHYTKYIRIAKCHAAQILPSQLSTDAMHTTTPKARSRTIHL